MTTKKEEPKYMGRYGEVLEDVHEDRSLLVQLDNGETVPYSDPKVLDLVGWGIDEKGVKRRVRFDVSRKTGKKCGFYGIYRSREELNELSINDYPNNTRVEECHYLNDLLHGDDIFIDGRGRIIKKICFLRGRQLNGKGYIGNAYDGGPIFGEVEKRARKNTAEKSRNLRRLFSDASVKEAIKTGNLLKVKTAMTRAIKKKEMDE